MAFNPDNLLLISKLSTTSRKIPKEFKPALDEISSSIGEVVWAWNYCHAAFHRLFAELVNPSNLLIGYSIWHVIQNDSSQRDMVLLAAKEALKKQPRVFSRIAWAVERVNKLGEKRNDVIHLATALQVARSKTSFVVDPMSNRPSRVRRLQGQKIHDDLPALRGDLVAMANYVSTIGSELIIPGRYPWPRRPQLQSIPKPQGGGKKPTRRKNDIMRQSQRQPSRARSRSRP